MAPVTAGEYPTPSASQPSSWTNVTPPNGTPNPTQREEPAEVYYPSGHEVILFGGSGLSAQGSPVTPLDDTWAYSDGHWTELLSGKDCLTRPCPSPRAGAMLAYYPPLEALVLFGGSGSIVPNYRLYNDTWLFSNGAWKNITGTAGTPPEARDLGSMTYDSFDNYILLFGGANRSSTALGDTWKFAGGSWTNITSTLTLSPTPRYSAAIADSPDGYVLLFGGDNETFRPIQNGCNPAVGPYVAMWFHDGQWSPQAGWQNTCTPTPASSKPASQQPDSATPQEFPPCGRAGAALGWSPGNNRFVLYGGIGSRYSTATLQCTPITDQFFLNDTWTYALPSGGGFAWNNASYPAGPPGRWLMGYASDFTDNSFEIFGGERFIDLPPPLELANDTWRFYEIVYAKITGPYVYDTGGGPSNQGFGPFIVLGYGGTGDLNYGLTVVNTRNDNKLDAGTSGPCDWFYNSSSTPLPFNGTVLIHCVPGPQAYGVYRITLTVTDEGNPSHPSATANWTFEVTPQILLYIYSEYVRDFYTNINFNNTFTIFSSFSGTPPTNISATLGGKNLTLTESGSSGWWNTTSIDMSSFQPGTILIATAQFQGWTAYEVYVPIMISTPWWLLSLFNATGAKQSIQTYGAGPFNKTFAIDESYSWDLTDATDFSIPVPLVGGDYDMIPSVNVLFSANSMGNLTLTGTFSLSTPTIDLSGVSLQVTANLSMSGTFEIVGSGVQWIYASATISVNATISGSVPIYGFSILGCNVGITLQLTVSPSITLEMILGPSASPNLFGVDVAIQNFLGSFSLALSAAVNFGIGIASVGLGLGLSVAVAFQATPFGILAGWVNGSVFVTASFLFWSDSWNIIGPGTIYQWGAADPAARDRIAFLATDYNNGTKTTWIVQPEYYAASSYDGDVWNATSSFGPAISDIYPTTELTAATEYNGAVFFYTDRNLSLPSSYGLVVSGASLNSFSNRLTTIPGPHDPADFEIANPVAATLPDGTLYVLWDALPNSEATVNSPLNLTSIELQGAVFYPNNDSWGPIRTYNVGDFAQSFQADATGNSGDVLELLSEQPFLSNNAPEYLVEYDLTTGAVLANLSVHGLSEVVSLRAAPGLVDVETLGGNYTLFSLPSGSQIAPAYTPPSGYHLISAAFAQDSSSTLILLYRGPHSSQLVVYNTTDAVTLATLSLGIDELQAEAIANGATTYVFARTIDGINGWIEVGGTFTNLTTVALRGIVNYGLVQVGGSIVIYSLVTTGGNATEPTRTLELNEIGASLGPAPPPPSTRLATQSGASSSPNYLLYLEIAAGAGAVVLAVMSLVSRRQRNPPTGEGVPPEAERTASDSQAPRSSHGG